ncbi:MAG TPA: T9SS type A sorting domain-containing protein, partial [Chitinophagaceae bacterium]
GSPTGTNITGTGMPATLVSSIAIGTDDNNLIATYSNYGSAHVWVSTSGGGSGGWTNISGDLPDIPVRWAMFYPDDNTKAIIATELGVYETSLINGPSTSWTRDPSFPTVLTAMLQYRRSDGTILAATHGRGLWTATVPFTTPAIRFSSAYRTQGETNSSTSGCRNYTDYTVIMTIDAAPTGDANVTVNVAGGATATQGVDFDYTTNGNFAAPSTALTFSNGSNASKTVTIRVYDDAEVESTESFTLNYTLSGSTNAVAAPNFQTYSFTITDNDAAPVAPFNGNFTVGTYNSNLGTTTPFRSNLQKHRVQALFTATELNAAGITSASNLTSLNLRVVTKNSTQPYNGFTISMINSAATDLSGGFVSGTFTQVYSGNYSTVVGDNTFTFSTPFAWDGTSNVVVQFCFDNSPNPAEALADVTEGNSAPLGALFPTCYANGGAPVGCSLAAAFISNFRINATFGGTGGNAIETVLNNNRTGYVGNNGSYYFYTTSSTNIINKLNGASANLGCVTSNIFEAGTAWQSFLGGQRSQKVFDITPTTNSGASYTVGIYFTSAELGGKAPGSLRIAKTTAATMAAANAGNTVSATTSFSPFGTGYLFTASFTGFSKFFLIDGSVVLPVTLLSFDGHLNNNNIDLKWSTSSEQNSKYFEIQKSSDGINFHPIGTKNAAGFSSLQRNYSFTDGQVNEFNYYRLKMADIDERFILSPVILIKSPNVKLDLWVVNNPFQSFIDIRFSRTPSQKLQFELFNMAGAEVYKREYGSSNEIRLDLSGVYLSTGVYILRTHVGGKLFVNKVVKN